MPPCHRHLPIATRLALGVLIPLGLAACAVWAAGDPAQFDHGQSIGTARTPWNALLSGGLLLAALGVALAMLHRNIRSILEPLEEARSALEALARGDYDRPVRIRRIDETSDMLIAIDDLSQYLAVMLPADEGEPEPPAVAPVTASPRPLVTVRTVPDFDRIVEQMLDDDETPFVIDGGTSATTRTEAGPTRALERT